MRLINNYDAFDSSKTKNAINVIPPPRDCQLILMLPHASLCSTTQLVTLANSPADFKNEYPTVTCVEWDCAWNCVNVG